MQVYKRCTMFVLAHILGTTELRQCTGTAWNIWIEVTNWEFSTIKDLLYFLEIHLLLKSGLKGAWNFVSWRNYINDAQIPIKQQVICSFICFFTYQSN